MTPEEYLASIADLVEHGKWTQYVAFGDGITTPVCLAGAIDHIYAQGAVKYDDFIKSCKAILAEIGAPDKYHLGYSVMGSWNDARGRTREEVVSTIRNAKRWL